MDRNRQDDFLSVRTTIDSLCAAISARDAAQVIALHDKDYVHFSLAPPLISRDHSGIGLQAWFATWAGRIGYDLSDLDVSVGGDLAMAHGLAHMYGRKADGQTVDLWFRETLGLRRQPDGWRITHRHSSVPFYMDGSFRAAVDLTPATKGNFDMPSDTAAALADRPARSGVSAHR